jgi:hypothetical protein
MALEDDREDGPYDVPTTGTLCRSRPCGCSVGLLSDVQEIPRRQRMHAGSIPNPWIVLPCEAHAGDPQVTVDSNEASLRERDQAREDRAREAIRRVLDLDKSAEEDREDREYLQRALRAAASDMAEPLTPPDTMRCQSTMGVVRCMSAPAVIVTGPKPGENKQPVSLSMCSGCFRRFHERHPSLVAQRTPIDEWGKLCRAQVANAIARAVANACPIVLALPAGTRYVSNGHGGRGDQDAFDLTFEHEGWLGSEGPTVHRFVIIVTRHPEDE